MPLPVAADDVMAAVADARDAMVPASEAERRAAMWRLMRFCGVPEGWREDGEAYITDYCALIGDLPPDLLGVAVWRWLRRSPFFPAPAELLAEVADEMAARRFAWTKLESAVREVEAQ